MSAHAAPPQAPAVPGARPTGFLGAGGFADVFLYEQEIPRRDVAVKVIRSGAGPEAHRRFEAEANLMARMSSHPSILSVYGAGTVDGDRNYLMMEYCPPPHLGKRAAAQPLSVTRALEVAVQVAGAVETIHRAGYLHRDIKPANILVTSFNRPVLTDFGIAAPIGERELDDEFGGASPPWAPPEQQLDDDVLTAAADVYALAATVYTLLAGRSPHLDVTGAGRNDQLSMLDRVLHRPVPPIGREDVPTQLERVLATAMAKRPEDRYPSAFAFARAIQQVQTDLQLPATPLDVMEEEVVAPDTSGEASDATVLRPVTTIDPDGPTGTLPGATNPVVGVRPDATRFVPRRVEAQPADPMTERTHERFNVPRPQGAPGLPPGPRLTTAGDDGQAREDLDVTMSAAEYRRLRGMGETPSPDDAPGADRGEDRRRPARMSVVAALAGVLVLAVGAVASWSLLRGEGGTSPTDTRTTAVSVLGPPPGVSSIVAVSDLTVTLQGDVVDVSWTYDGAATGVTYLYRISDPAEPYPVQETADTHASVRPVSGRTCVEVVARDAEGTSSEAAVACVDTPGAQGGQ